MSITCIGIFLMSTTRLELVGQLYTPVTIATLHWPMDLHFASDGIEKDIPERLFLNLSLIPEDYTSFDIYLTSDIFTDDGVTRVDYEKLDTVKKSRVVLTFKKELLKKALGNFIKKRPTSGKLYRDDKEFLDIILSELFYQTKDILKKEDYESN